MCHAAWSKGTSALLIAIRAVAQRHGVEDPLAELWGRVQPAVLARSESEGSVAGRAWRWVDEMTEIARTFEDAGLPGDAALGAARLYERLVSFKDVKEPPALTNCWPPSAERYWTTSVGGCAGGPADGGAERRAPGSPGSPTGGG